MRQGGRYRFHSLLSIICRLSSTIVLILLTCPRMRSSEARTRLLKPFTASNCTKELGLCKETVST